MLRRGTVCTMLVVVALVGQQALAHEKVDYSGFSVFDVFPTSSAEAAVYRELELSAGGVLLWQPLCTTPNLRCQAVVSPEGKVEFLRTLRSLNTSFDESVLSLQQMIDDEARRIARYRANRENAHTTTRGAGLLQENPWDLEFHTYGETMAWLNDTVNAHPDIATLINLGQSFEGRDMLGIRLTLNANAPKIFFDAGVHAREWATPATTGYMINQLVDGYARGDPEVISLLTRIDWYMLPIANPDGYEYTWTTDRLWRKTRSPNPGNACVGKDPNRNADSGFGGPGSSDNPCSETYRGPAAFSEPEVLNIANYIRSLGPNVRGYDNIHAAAQMLLSPFAYTPDPPADAAAHNEMHEKCSSAIASVVGAQYVYGPTYFTIYPAAGNINDWVYETAGVKYAVCWELRGGGFVPPPSFIVESGREIWLGKKVFVDIIADEFEAEFGRYY